MNLHVAHRLRLWRNLQRLCFPAGGPRPMPRLNRSLTLTSAKHDSDHSPAPPSLSGPQPDAQQPLLREEEPQPRVQSAELDIKDSSAGPAQKVLQQGSQTPTADPTKVSESSLPFVCNECGLKFRHRRDLDNHQELSKAERTLLGQTGGCKDRISVAGMKVKPHLLKAQDPRDLRLTVGLGGKIFEKSFRELEPSTAAVSEDSGYQVVSTFNASLHDVSHISVPGSPPLWKDLELPVHIPQEPPKKAQPGHRNSKTLSLLMHSTQTTSSEFRHDQVDIVTNVGLLGRLLALCKAPDPTLPSFGRIEHGSLQPNFRTHFTEMPPGLGNSTHYRSVQYIIGHVNCVVQGQPEALCSIPPDELEPSSPPSPVGPVATREVHLQSRPALIQFRRDKRYERGARHESLWFSRVPLILRAHLSHDDNITAVSKVDASEEVRKWEKRANNQTALRKLATLLSDLKSAVKAAAPDGQACFGLMERNLDPPTIQVFLADGESKGLAEDVGNNPSVGKTSHGPEEVLEGAQQEPASAMQTPQDKTSSSKYGGVAQ